MGDRANIFIDEGNQKGVFLYTHWQGHRLPLILRDALKLHQRWDDPPYLTRIIFCRMIGKDNWNKVVGFGISANIGDNSYDALVVDCQKQEVRLVSQDDDEHPWDGKVLKTWSFPRFIELTDDELLKETNR